MLLVGISGSILEFYPSASQPAEQPVNEWDNQTGGRNPIPMLRVGYCFLQKRLLIPLFFHPRPFGEL